MQVVEWPSDGTAHGGSETKPLKPTDQPWRKKARATSGLPVQSIFTELSTLMSNFLKQAVVSERPISGEIGQCDEAVSSLRADLDDLVG